MTNDDCDKRGHLRLQETSSYYFCGDIYVNKKDFIDFVMEENCKEIIFTFLLFLYFMYDLVI